MRLTMGGKKQKVWTFQRWRPLLVFSAMYEHSHTHVLLSYLPCCRDDSVRRLVEEMMIVMAMKSGMMMIVVVVVG